MVRTMLRLVKSTQTKSVFSIQTYYKRPRPFVNGPKMSPFASGLNPVTPFANGLSLHAGCNIYTTDSAGRVVPRRLRAMRYSIHACAAVGPTAAAPPLAGQGHQHVTACDF